MSVAKDPFESYLQRASELFEEGDVVKAGQIWQAILKKQPGHEAARAGLYKVKLYFDARATQDGLVKSAPLLPVAPAAAPGEVDPEVTRLLEEGCGLYDAGQVDAAIALWEKALSREPENAMAHGYINGAKRAQIQGPDWDGLDPEGDQARSTADFGQVVAAQEPAPEAAPAEAPAIAPPPPPPVAAPEAAPDVDVEQLLRDGCTLYDMGQPEDALKKWEKALIADPKHALARSYIKDARKDLGLPPLDDDAIPAPAAEAPSASNPAQSLAPDEERLEQMVREGVQLFDMGMAQEAIVKWQQVLESAPEHRDAKAYMTMAEKDLQSAPQAARVPPPPMPAPMSAPVHAAPRAPAQPAAPEIEAAFFAPMDPITLVDFEPPSPAAAPSPSAAPVAPPKALTSPKGASPRKGLPLPPALQGLALPSWLNSPLVLLGGIAGLVILIVGSIAYHRWRKDVELRDAVATFSAQALQPVARSSQIISLDESPDGIRKEAQDVLSDDPLRAFYRAQELVRLNPGDAPSAELLERAKEAMASAAISPAPTVADYERQKASGDLDSADKSLTQLLLLSPDDASLKERAAHLLSALCQMHASREEWPEAENCLKRGRALVPLDKTWGARLRLLEQVQQMPKAARYPWIHLLG